MEEHPLEHDSLRPKRSRKDRPCDHCRRSKRSCLILVRGEACDNCAKSGRECSFRAPPLNRHRKEPYAVTPLPPSSVPRSLAGRFGSHGTAHMSTSSPREWVAERSTANHGRTSSVRAFLDSLDDERVQEIDDDAHRYSSLDATVTEEEESHYLGSGAVAQLASVSLDARLEDGAPNLPYRQVADPRHPAFFLRNPSRVYGHSNAAFAAEKAYQEVLGIITAIDPLLPDKLVRLFMTRTLPALPILNEARFDASLRAGGTSFPYALLVGILVHSAVYEPILMPVYKQLWTICLNVLDNEYRQARLRTLQLEIFNLAGRPLSNPGGNHLGICRAVGAIQLLGLHRDCSRWKLPKWERSLRKRLWWTLYIHDKWNAYTYGRPVNIDSTTSTIPAVSFDEGDNGGATTVNESEIAVFIALCRLSSVLESLLPLLLDRDTFPRRHNLDRSLLRHAASDLETLYRDLPDQLVYHPSHPLPPARPGSRSLQLSHLGVELLICRLGLEREDFETLHHLAQANQQALGVVDGMASFLEQLDDDDLGAFWSPWAAYQLTNAITLLLQQAIRMHQAAVGTGTPEIILDTAIRDTFALLGRMVRAVQAASPHWEVANSALPRINSLVKSMPPIPGIEGLQALLAGPSNPPEWPVGLGDEPDSDVLALFDWLNGDIESMF